MLILNFILYFLVSGEFRAQLSKMFSFRCLHVNSSTLPSEDQKSGKKPGKTYYVVLRSFSQFESADAYKVRIKEDQDINTSIYFNRKSKKYLVYIYKTTKNRDANKELKAVQELTKFKRVQVVEVEN